MYLLICRFPTLNFIAIYKRYMKCHFPVRLPTCRSRMTTRKPSLGLTRHIYNRLHAGCYRTIDLDFKELNSPFLTNPYFLVCLHRNRSIIANLLLFFENKSVFNKPVAIAVIKIISKSLPDPYFSSSSGPTRRMIIRLPIR